MKMHTTALTCFKGGVAKTTSTRYIGYILAHTFGKRVLLVDLDPQGNLTDFFGHTLPDGAMKGVAPVISDMAVSIRDEIVSTSYEGLDLLPGNKMIETAEKAILLDVQIPQQFRLKQKLSEVAHQYDYCLIDCPPRMNVIVANAYVAADDLIIPTTYEPDAVKGARDAIQSIYAIAPFSPLSLRGILFTRVGSGAIVRRGVSDESLSQVFPTFEHYIRDSQAVLQHRMNEQMAYHKTSPEKSSYPILDYENVVSEYLGLPPRFEDAASRTALKQRLTKQTEKRRPKDAK